MKSRVHPGPTLGTHWVRLAAIPVLVVMALLLAFSFPSPAQAQPIAAPYDSGLVWGDWQAPGTVLFNTGTTAGVSYGPPHPATFTTSSTYTITSITNYHWGHAPAGDSISLLAAGGATIMSWPVGWTGITSYWYVRPNFTIGPGTYTIVDSSPSTWSYTNTGRPCDGMGMTRVLVSASTNNAPVMSTATVTSSDASHAYEGSTLTASGTATDADALDTLTYEYDWFVNGSTTGQTGSTLSGAYFNRGQSVTCKIRAYDGTAYSDWLPSNAIIIANSAPVITSDGGGPTASIYVSAGSTFVTDVNATDADPGDVLRYRIVTPNTAIMRFASGPAMFFTISSTTGVLSFTSGAARYLGFWPSQLQYTYKVTVQVQDSSSPALSDTQALTITVGPGA